MRGALLMLGLLGAAALNGQFAVVENWVIGQRHGAASVARRRLRGACASAVFVAIWLVSQRLLRESPFRREIA